MCDEEEDFWAAVEPSSLPAQVCTDSAQDLCLARASSSSTPDRNARQQQPLDLLDADPFVESSSVEPSSVEPSSVEPAGAARPRSRDLLDEEERPEFAVVEDDSDFFAAGTHNSVEITLEEKGPPSPLGHSSASGLSVLSEASANQQSFLRSEFTLSSEPRQVYNNEALLEELAGSHDRLPAADAEQASRSIVRSTDQLPAAETPTMADSAVPSPLGGPCKRADEEGGAVEEEIIVVESSPSERGPSNGTPERQASPADIIAIDSSSPADGLRSQLSDTCSRGSSSAFDSFRGVLVSSPLAEEDLKDMQEWVATCPRDKTQFTQQFHTNMDKWAASLAASLGDSLRRDAAFAAAVRRRETILSRQGLGGEPEEWLFLECLERLLLSRLKEKMSFVFAAEIKEDAELEEKLHWCRIWMKPQFLDVPAAVEDVLLRPHQEPLKFTPSVDGISPPQSRAAFEDGTNDLAELLGLQLNILARAPSVRAKLTAVVNVASIATLVASTLTQGSNISADHLLPILIWCLIRTRRSGPCDDARAAVLGGLITGTEYVATLRHPRLRRGSETYQLTMFQAATEFLRQMRVFRDLRIESDIVRRVVHQTCPENRMADWLGGHLELMKAPSQDSNGGSSFASTLFRGKSGEKEEKEEEDLSPTLQRDLFNLRLYKTFVTQLSTRSELLPAMRRLKSFIAFAESSDSKLLLDPSKFHAFVATTVRLLLPPHTSLHIQLLPPETEALSKVDRRLCFVLCVTECLERYLFERLHGLLKREIIRRIQKRSTGGLITKLLAQLQRQQSDGSSSSVKAPKDDSLSPLEKAVAQVQRKCGAPPAPVANAAQSDISLIARRVGRLGGVESPRDILRICVATAAVVNASIAEDRPQRKAEVLVALAKLLLLTVAPVDVQVEIGKLWRSPLLLSATDRVAILLFELAILAIIQVSREDSLTAELLEDKLLGAAVSVLSQQQAP